MHRRKFLELSSASGLMLCNVSPSAGQTASTMDYRRVIVAVYYMPKREGECLGCRILEKELPQVMAKYPDAWFGVSRDGRTPSILATNNGKSHQFRRTKPSKVETYPTVCVYSGTMGDWGFERYRLTGYSAGDCEKLGTLVEWAAKI